MHKPQNASTGCASRGCEIPSANLSPRNFLPACSGRSTDHRPLTAIKSAITADATASTAATAESTPESTTFYDQLAVHVTARPLTAIKSAITADATATAATTAESTPESTTFYDEVAVHVASQILGYVGGVLVISLNIPQIVLIIRKRSADNLSITSIFLHLLAGVLFVTYGILINQWPLIASNVAYIIVSLTILTCKCYFDRYIKKRQEKKTVIPRELDNTVDGENTPDSQKSERIIQNV